jgi:hypothetical protein
MAAIAGLVPAIHVVTPRKPCRTGLRFYRRRFSAAPAWMPATSAGMTISLQ